MSTCQRCGSPLAFTKLPSGKLRPSNPDGSDHFDLCRKLFMDKVRQFGTPFSTETEKGYRFNGETIVTESTGKTITGSLYAPHNPSCTTPPWEHCSC